MADPNNPLGLPELNPAIIPQAGQGGVVPAPVDNPLGLQQATPTSLYERNLAVQQQVAGDRVAQDYVNPDEPERIYFRTGSKVRSIDASEAQALIDRGIEPMTADEIKEWKYRKEIDSSVVSQGIEKLQTIGESAATTTLGIGSLLTGDDESGVDKWIRMAGGLYGSSPEEIKRSMRYRESENWGMSMIGEAAPYLAATAAAATGAGAIAGAVGAAGAGAATIPAWVTGAGLAAEGAVSNIVGNREDAALENIDLSAEEQMMDGAIGAGLGLALPVVGRHAARYGKNLLARQAVKSGDTGLLGKAFGAAKKGARAATDWVTQAKAIDTRTKPLMADDKFGRRFLQKARAENPDLSEGQLDDLAQKMQLEWADRMESYTTKEGEKILSDKLPVPFVGDGGFSDAALKSGGKGRAGNIVQIHNENQRDIEGLFTQMGEDGWGISHAAIDHTIDKAIKTGKARSFFGSVEEGYGYLKPRTKERLIPTEAMGEIREQAEREVRQEVAERTRKEMGETLEEVAGTTTPDATSARMEKEVADLLPGRINEKVANFKHTPETILKQRDTIIREAADQSDAERRAAAGLVDTIDEILKDTAEAAGKGADYKQLRQIQMDTQAVYNQAIESIYGEGRGSPVMDILAGMGARLAGHDLNAAQLTLRGTRAFINNAVGQTQRWARARGMFEGQATIKEGARGAVDSMLSKVKDKSKPFLKAFDWAKATGGYLPANHGGTLANLATQNTFLRDHDSYGAAYQDNIRLLAEAGQNPEEAFGDMMGDESGFDQVMAGQGAVYHRALSYLTNEMPSGAGGRNPLQPNTKKAAPAEAEVVQYGRKWQAVTNPWSVINDIAQGSLKKETVEAVAAVYPAMYEELQMIAIEKLGEMKEPLDYQQAKQVEVLLQQPGILTRTGSPQFQQSYNMVIQQFEETKMQGPPQGTPGRSSGNPTLSQQMRSPVSSAMQNIGN